MAQHNELGKKGEDMAVSYLEEKNFRILQRNWVFDKNEIDIIAMNTDFIVFVEVKTRSNDRWGNPEEAVSNAKIKRIVEAASCYLQESTESQPARFDVISIILNEESVEIEHIEDAFYPPLN